MTTERIDVLAVMDASAEKITFLAQKTGVYHPATELAEARAAVAELIEAAARLVKLANEASTEGRFADGMGEELTALEDTQAALARVSGGAA